MEHQEAWLMLDEYHDGELSPQTASLVRDHLKACPECLGELTGREYLARVISAAADVQPSEEFARRVSRLVSEAPVESAPALRWPVPVMAVALAASAFIMVGLYSSAPKEAGQTGLISTSFEYEKAGPMPLLEQGTEIANHDQILGSLLEES